LAVTRFVFEKVMACAAGLTTWTVTV